MTLAGGSFLGIWSCMAGVAASVGMLNTFLCTSARNVQSMACKGLLPAVLQGEVGDDGTPTPGLYFSSLCVCCLLSLDFSRLIEVRVWRRCGTFHRA